MDKNTCSLNIEKIIDAATELKKFFNESESEFESRFEFLADLFPSFDSVPTLAELAEFGRDAEINLHTNTRYSVICLGDIGEAIAYILLSIKNIAHEKDQIDRIKMLASRSIIPKNIADILHKLRIARNQAIHSRYNLEADAEILLAQALEACEWIFRFIISPNDIVKAKITGENENNIFAEIGNISAIAEKSNAYCLTSLSSDDNDKRLFRVLEVNDENIKLSLENVNSNPWTVLERRYDKYQIGQDVNAIIKTLTKTMGATVELKDGLIAKIPDSELGRRIFNRSRGIKYEVKARIKWFDPKHYPYMVLSVKDLENEEKRAKENEIPKDTQEQNETVEAIPNAYFFDMCKTANSKQISEELEKGADPNSRDRNGNTPLILAAGYNQNHDVLKVLIDAGAKLNSRNHKGQTALILAAIYNTHKAIKILLNAGADINISGRDNLKAISYAMSNKKISNNKTIIKLLKGQKPKRRKTKIKTSTSKEVINTMIAVKTTAEYQKEFLRTCRSGTEEEIQEAINAGVNVNVKNKSLSNALMFAAKNNTAASVEILIKAGAYLDAQDIFGNTALIYAASFNTDDVVKVLIDSGADIEMTNISGYKAVDYAKQNYRLEDSDVIKKL